MLRRRKQRKRRTRKSEKSLRRNDQSERNEQKRKDQNELRRRKRRKRKNDIRPRQNMIENHHVDDRDQDPREIVKENVNERENVEMRIDDNEKSKCERKNFVIVKDFEKNRKS